MMRGLYAITPEVADGQQLLSYCRAVLLGGCRLLQYRAKAASPERRYAEAAALRALCRDFGARLIINDDVTLALAVGADGVHLGEDDGDLASARAALGAQRLLGASCYNDLASAHRAIEAGADHVAFGAVFPSATKPAARQAPLTLLSEARRQLAVPVCAIGGITLAEAGAVIAAGADVLAVITDLFAAADITARAAAYQALFEPAQALCCENIHDRS